MDPLDTHGDRLRRALHAETQTFVCDPYALDRIRARTAADSRRGHLIAFAALMLLILFIAGGS